VRELLGKVDPWTVRCLEASAPAAATRGW